MLVVLVVNISITIALWLCLEAIVWLSVDEQVSLLSKIQFVTMTSRDFVVADSDRGFRLRANFSVPALHVNSQGLRGKELPKDLVDKRLILALGESTTFGWPVTDDEAYPSRLEAILNSATLDNSNVVVNAGVPSYSSKQVLLYTEYLLTRFHPDIVLVSILWNDLFYSSLEDWTPQSLIPSYPSKLWQMLLAYSPLCRWLASKPTGPQLVDFYSLDALMEYKRNVAQIARLCKSRGISVLFVEPSFSEQMISDTGETIWKNRFSRQFLPKLADIFLSAQIEAIESQEVPLIRHPLGISERSTSENFLDFVHPDEKGNEIIAQVIANYLENKGRSEKK